MPAPGLLCRFGCRRGRRRHGGAPGGAVPAGARGRVPVGVLEVPAAAHHPRHHPGLVRRHRTGAHREPRGALACARSADALMNVRPRPDGRHFWLSAAANRYDALVPTAVVRATSCAWPIGGQRWTLNAASASFVGCFYADVHWRIVIGHCSGSVLPPRALQGMLAPLSSKGSLGMECEPSSTACMCSRSTGRHPARHCANAPGTGLGAAAARGARRAGAAVRQRLHRGHQPGVRCGYRRRQ